MICPRSSLTLENEERKKKEVEWTETVELISKTDFLAAGKAIILTYSRLKKKKKEPESTLDSSGFRAEGT